MKKCIYDVSKFLVFIVNFSAYLASGGTLSLCIWGFLNSEELFGIRITPELSPENPSALYFSLVLILFVIFSFLFIFTFLGCCGAATQNRCMLGSFIIILSVFLGVYVAGLIYIFAFADSEIKLLKEELYKTIPYYDVTDDISLVRHFWDEVQKNLECCGAFGYQDWQSCDKLKPGRKVPSSCCHPGEDCVFDPSSFNAHIRGCVSAVEFYIKVIVWGLLGVMVTVLLLSFVVYSRAGRRIRTNGSRKRFRQTPDAVSQYSEETGYVYRGGDSVYNPPYNPAYPVNDNYSNGITAPSEYRQPLINMPGGPPTHQPQPPPYNDVIGSSYQSRS